MGTGLLTCQSKGIFRLVVWGIELELLFDTNAYIGAMTSADIDQDGFDDLVGNLYDIFR